MFVFALTIFLSAFLLFQVQPIIAKVLLPWFGGSSAVWTTCMLFFQLVLLAGYGYAHWLHGLRRRAQAAVHSVLLAASLAVLPILPRAAWKPRGAEDPLWLLLGLLAATVGLPYFLLSSTSPLLQDWYARSRKQSMPYRLFALSNFASMLALLSYPPLVEPNLTTHAQAQVWSWGYVCFAMLCAGIAWMADRRPAEDELHQAMEQAAGTPPPWSLRLLWTALAACASILLLAVTTFLTQDVASIPFLWILPLSVYLLSFIICFEWPRLYWRPAFYALLVPALAACAYCIHNDGTLWGIWKVIGMLAAALFVFCMVCHGELAALKPAPRYLTGFYLMISLGGAVGGVFVGLLAPHLFHAYYEFPIGLGLCAVLATVLLFVRGALAGRWRKLAAMVPLLAYLVVVGIVVRDMVSGYTLVVRNFYGRLAIQDDPDPAHDPQATRSLMHGVIEHGMESLHREYQRMALGYYCPSSGIGIAMRVLPQGVPRRLGILGLGCGQLTVYAQPGDTTRIYEINPLVLDLARSQFTYLRDTPARTEIVMGDARLSLESEPAQRFDLLAVDVFTGDAIPTHLVTREAFGTYFRHIKQGGILAVHISNQHLDLRPVVERAASDFGKVAVLFDYDKRKGDFLCDDCRWVLVADPAARERLTGAGGNVLTAYAGFREWTDDYSTMHRILH